MEKEIINQKRNTIKAFGPSADKENYLQEKNNTTLSPRIKRELEELKLKIFYKDIYQHNRRTL